MVSRIWYNMELPLENMGFGMIPNFVQNFSDTFSLWELSDTVHPRLDDIRFVDKFFIPNIMLGKYCSPQCLKSPARPERILRPSWPGWILNISLARRKLRLKSARPGTEEFWDRKASPKGWYYIGDISKTVHPRFVDKSFALLTCFCPLKKRTKDGLYRIWETYFFENSPKSCRN